MWDSNYRHQNAQRMGMGMGMGMRIYLTRLVDMHAHKNAQYQEVIATMSAEIMRKNELIGRANGEILALRQALLSMRMARCQLPCSMQAGRAFV